MGHIFTVVISVGWCRVANVCACARDTPLVTSRGRFSQHSNGNIYVLCFFFFSLYVAHIGLMYCGDHISNYHHLSILKEICMSFHNIYNTY